MVVVQTIDIFQVIILNQLLKLWMKVKKGVQVLIARNLVALITLNKMVHTQIPKEAVVSRIPHLVVIQTLINPAQTDSINLQQDVPANFVTPIQEVRMF